MMTRQKWTLSGLAVELQLDRRAVARLLDGCPVAGESRDKAGRVTRTYYLADIVRHLGNGDSERLDLSAERAKLARAQQRVAELDAAKRELELGKLRGELVHVDEVAHTWARIAGNVRARLLAIPSGVAYQLACASTPGECQELVRQAVYEALTELSDPERGVGGGAGED